MAAASSMEKVIMITVILQVHWANILKKLISFCSKDDLNKILGEKKPQNQLFPSFFSQKRQHQPSNIFVVTPAYAVAQNRQVLLFSRLYKPCADLFMREKKNPQHPTHKIQKNPTNMSLFKPKREVKKTPYGYSGMSFRRGCFYKCRLHQYLPADEVCLHQGQCMV